MARSKLTTRKTNTISKLVDEIRDLTVFEKVNDLIDTRIEATLDFLNIPTTRDIKRIERKINKLAKSI